MMTRPPTTESWTRAAKAIRSGTHFILRPLIAEGCQIFRRCLEPRPEMRNLEVHERAHPIFWQSGMSLAGQIFGEKEIARSECSNRAVADSDLHRP